MGSGDRSCWGAKSSGRGVQASDYIMIPLFVLILSPNASRETFNMDRACSPKDSRRLFNGRRLCDLHRRSASPPPRPSSLCYGASSQDVWFHEAPAALTHGISQPPIRARPPDQHHCRRIANRVPPTPTASSSSRTSPGGNPSTFETPSSSSQTLLLERTITRSSTPATRWPTSSTSSRRRRPTRPARR